MTGMVSGGLQALLEVRGPSGRSQDVETVIDTGFNGERVWPRAIVAALALDHSGSYPAMLADGTHVVLDYDEAVEIWHGRLRTVRALQTHTLALLGRELLKGSRFTMDTVPGGAVMIEEIP
jgi:clan AA aspartic protease